MGLVKSFQQNGWEVIAIAPRDEYSTLLENEGCKFIPIEIENKGSNPLKDIILFFKLLRVYKSVKPDIILQFTIKPNIYGTLAAKFAGIPVVNNVSGLGTVFLHNNLTSKIARFLYKIAFRFPEKVFFQNEDDRELFVKNQLIKKGITDVLPGSGVNIEKFIPTDFKRNQPFVFLLAARLLFDKGIIEFAEAARIIKNKNLPARFILIGSMDPGPLSISERTLKGWQKDGILEYLTFRDDIRSAIALADCVVLPSYREGTPKSLLEAASMGKPLIATDVPGCRDVVNDGQNGFLCKAKDALDLSSKMEQMMQLSDAELRALGENSRKIVVLKYDEKLVVNEYIKTITKRISGNR